MPRVTVRWCDMILAVENENSSFARVIALHGEQRDGQHVLLMCELHIGVRVHAGIDAEVLVGHVDLGLHGASIEPDVAGEADDLAGERAMQRVDADLHRVAIVDVAHRIFRHRQTETEQIAL